MRGRATNGWAMLLGIAVTAIPARTQEAPAADAISTERVRQVLSFLAADELGGRNTPSPGLQRAAEYLAKGFRAAGLEPLDEEGSFFHVYETPGVALDSRRVEVVVHVPDGEDVVLRADEDVRLWQAAGPFTQERGEVLRLDAATAASSRLELRRGGTKPILVEVAVDSSLWRDAAGRRERLVARRRGPSPPWLLVRQGALPQGTFTATVRVAEPEPVTVRLTNVVGVRRGTTAPGEYVLVSAHYDHIGIGLPEPGGDSINNGADDDASGTTAVLLLAEAMKTMDAKLPRSVLFVCFSGEEKGLLGSQAFAEKPPVPLADVVANVNLEMIGRPPEGGRLRAWVTGRELSDFEQVVAPALQRAGIECVPFAMEAQLFGASDNISLARAGVVAHSISAGSLHQDYHRPGDEVEKVDLEHMTQVVRGLYEVAVELASREQRLQWNERGRAKLSLPPSRR